MTSEAPTIFPPDAAADDPADARTSAETAGVAWRDDAAGLAPLATFVKRVPIGFARLHGVMAFADERGDPILAMSGLAAWPQADVLSRFLGVAFEPCLMPAASVAAAVNAAYEAREGQAGEAVATLSPPAAGDTGRAALLAEVEAVAAAGGDDLLDSAGRAPVIKLVNLILFEAVKAGASDVHVQPRAADVLVRLRVDGVLYDGLSLPGGVRDEVVGRLKVMGRMDIAERRLAQDGRAGVRVGDRLVDLRLSSLPGSHGERVVVRLLDKSARLYRLPELGMDPRMLGGFRRVLRREHGLVLVTGPTGSGKTTTLYAALQELDVSRLNVLTLEDPIEYELEGVSQTQVSGKKGMTFASGLRSVLRQDPDVIMVGEVRDGETAAMAIQSALTGHLVFSTLHTNDAAGAVTRLLDLGVEPYLVASSVVGVLAQRLVRRVCDACAEARPATRDERRWLAAALGREPPENLELRRGAGLRRLPRQRLSRAAGALRAAGGGRGRARPDRGAGARRPRAAGRRGRRRAADARRRPRARQLLLLGQGALAAQRVVERDPRGDVRTLPDGVGERVEEAHRLDQVRREAGHVELALEQRLADQAEVELLEVAQPAVEELRGPAGGARGQVAGLHEGHRQTAGRRVESGAGADDAAADHHHVEPSRRLHPFDHVRSRAPPGPSREGSDAGVEVLGLPRLHR